MQPVEMTDEQAAMNLGMCTPKERAFVEQLLCDPEFSIIEAAKKAGYKSPQTASSTVLTRPRVQQLIGQMLHKRSQANKITADRVLQELAGVAFQQPKQYLDENGMPIPLHELPDNVAVALKDLKVTVTYEENGEESVLKHVAYRYQCWDKMEALTMLAKHVGILQEVNVNLTNVCVNWGELYATIRELAKVEEDDPVEKRIAEAALVEVIEPKKE